MESTSYTPTDSFHLHLPYNPHKPHFLFPKPLLKPYSLKTSYQETNKEEENFYLPIKIQHSGKFSRYVWDGSQLQLVPINGYASNQLTLNGFDRLYKFCGTRVRDFLIPNQVQGNYIEYVKWKFLHRVFSSALQVLATQAMFRAMGVGFSRSLPSAAALNWVLKDGIGKLSRCVYSACLASAFDSKLKRVRFSTSMVFSLSIGVELLTPFCPRYFLLLATVANIAKQISLACYLSTRTAVHRSFAVAGNICEISAKAQIQTVCFDSLGLILAALLNFLCKNHPRLQAGLPLVVYPIFSAIDLLGIYQGLKHVHLQTLTKDRLEIILDTWIQLGFVPSPSEVSEQEGIGFPWYRGRKRWPIRIGCVDHKAPISKFSMLTMSSMRSKEFYFICMETSKRGFARSWQKGILLSLHTKAGSTDIIMGLLQACHIRRILTEEIGRWEHITEANDISESVLMEWFQLVDDCKKCVTEMPDLLTNIKTSGWAHKNILLSSEEQVKYSFLDD